MKLSISIEIDDAAPNIELCGENCQFLKKGNCQLFNIELEENGQRKIDDFDGKTIVYDDTVSFFSWKRNKKCIDIFYAFCDG